ncbi:MAG: GerMN domain-containing protein [Clostridia bacterium]
MKKSKFAAVPVLLIMCACMAGCITNNNEYPPQLTLSDAMPPAVPTEHSSFEASLFFVSEYGKLLTPERRTVVCSVDSSRPASVIEALIAGPDSPEKFTPSMPQGVKLDRIELSGNVCNVYISGQNVLVASEWLTARAAVAATLYAVEGIPSINLYYNGMEPGYDGNAIGVAVPISESLEVYLNNVRHEYEMLNQVGISYEDSYVTRNVTLYFADVGNRLLIANNVDLNYNAGTSRDELVKLLVTELMESNADQNLESVMPDDLTFAEEPQVHDTGVTDVEKKQLPTSEPSENDDESVISVVFDRPEQQYDERLMCGAITMTLTGYIPNVQGVRISLRESDGTITPLYDGDYFTREDFKNYVGHYAYIAYPDAEGTLLYRVPRAMPGFDVYDAKKRLAEFFKGPAKPGVMFPLFSEADALDVYVTDDIAVVNWSDGFKNKLLNMLDTGESSLPKDKIERMFIYSVVNTLTELPGVKRVWMLENGKKLGMIDDIYLGNALLRNPGIMADG